MGGLGGERQADHQLPQTSASIRHPRPFCRVPLLPLSLPLTGCFHNDSMWLFSRKEESAKSTTGLHFTKLKIIANIQLKNQSRVSQVEVKSQVCTEALQRNGER